MRAGSLENRLAISIAEPSATATNIYYCVREPTAPTKIQGIANSPGRFFPDRFNSNPEGYALIYYGGSATENDPELDYRVLAEITAHEIGHCLGLLHINPGASVGPDDCVMDYRDSRDNPTSDINFLEGKFPYWKDPDHEIYDYEITQNELYHLQRWIGGIPESARAGTWDKPSGIFDGTPGICASLQFSIAAPSTTTIYNVEIIPSTGLENREVVASFPSLTASQLSDLQLTLPGYFSFEIVASSTPGGNEDIRATLGTGGNAIPPGGVVTLDLVQTLPGGGEVTLGTGTSIGQVALEPAKNVEVCRCGPNHENVNVTWSSGPGLRYSLQRSTNLIDWLDVPGMTNMEATGTLMSRTEVGAGKGKRQLFYRIISQLPQTP